MLTLFTLICFWLGFVLGIWQGYMLRGGHD
jgi:hypothetical protein